MRIRAIAATTAALAVVLPIAGCGGDDSASTTPGTTANALSDAAEAKSDARNAAALIETCFVESMDYGRCKAPSVLSQGGLKPGSGAGQVRVAEATATTYRIEAKSTSNAVFAIEKSASGETKRTCTGPGCTGGRW